MSVTRDAVLACLKTLNDPVSGKDIVELGLVKALTVDEGAVRFVLEVNPSHADAYAKLRDEADAAVKALEGVASVSAVLTAHSKQAPPPDLKLGRKSEPAGPEKIPGVDRIIAIASGNLPLLRILLVRWPPKAAAWACWMPMSTVRRSRGCWVFPAGLRRLMVKRSCRCATLA